MKLGKVVVGQLKNPKNGIFNGRIIPKSQESNKNWLKLLELDEPPEDGLYVRREQVKKPEKKGFLYQIAKAMVDYEKGKTGAKKPKAKDPLTTPLTAPIAPSSWLDLSPDIESDLLGLENAGHGEHIAIIGTGISGLTLAYILSKSRPDLKISLVDNRTEVGGWMQSKFVDTDGGKILFESGPRTLLPFHPGTEVLTRILYDIGARDQIMGAVPRDAGVNAKSLVLNGEVHFLPRNMKENVKFLGWGPLLRGGRLHALKDLFVKPRPHHQHDESVHSFISRRVGNTIADRMVSAVMRGIYGADARVLSARSVARLNRLFYLERTEQMGILAAMFSGSLSYLEIYARKVLPLAFDSLVLPESKEIDPHRSMVPVAKKYSLYGFRNGIQSVAKAIADHLHQNPQVKFHMDSEVVTIERDGSSKVKLTTPNDTITANVVVSTVAKSKMFEKSAPEVANELESTKYTSLAVVNVWVPDEETAKEAFGVLVPTSEHEWNTEKVLGIVFDSSIRKSMQSIDGKSGAPVNVNGSCLTVMLGGDLYDNSPEEVWERRALNALVKLKILDEKYLEPNSKIVTQTKIQKGAIPLYEVGHSIRQHRVHEELSKQFGNRVALIGMAYGRGSGVSDCVIDSLMLALRFNEQRKLIYPKFFFDNWWHATRPELYA